MSARATRYTSSSEFHSSSSSVRSKKIDRGIFLRGMNGAPLFFMGECVLSSGNPFTQCGQAVNIENGQERYSNAQPVHIDAGLPFTSSRCERRASHAVHNKNETENPRCVIVRDNPCSRESSGMPDSLILGKRGFNFGQRKTSKALCLRGFVVVATGLEFRISMKFRSITQHNVL